VTIDLRGLDHIDLDPGHTNVSVGSGATWKSVYSYLDPLNLTVNGGRTANVGVGGLTLGGGISYFGPRYGWTCDTVLNFEVVLANGTIASANKDDNPDLFWALRGGSNNFGIVTRVDLRPIEQGGLWGGIVFHDLNTKDEQIAAFVNFSQAENYDVYSSLITTFSYSHLGSEGVFSVATNMEYTKPVADPPVFQSIASIPSLQSTMRITNMTDLSTETQLLQQPGFRYASRMC
jgi:FAD/FMN-containing dehydrogenase